MRSDEAVATWPLTEAQQGLWFAQRIDPSNPILNCGQYLDIGGPLDVAALADAFAELAAEAEPLSLRFAQAVDGTVVQWIDPDQTPSLEIRDLTGEADPRAAALADMAADTKTAIDVTREKLACFRVYRIAADRHLLYERIHHLATDGYAIVLVTNRLAELYSQRVGGVSAGRPLAPLAVALEEDAAYRIDERRASDRAFWLEAMAGLPEAATLAPGISTTAHRFHRETSRLGRDRMETIRTLGDRANVAWPDALTALVAAYWRRFTGETEAVIGVPHMGRLGSKAARMPGMVMNVLPLRADPDEDAPLADFLAGIAKTLARARRHGRYRSEQLRRDLGLVGGQRRLYGPLVNVQPFDNPPKMHGLDVTLHILGAGAVDDITFTFRGDGSDGMIFEVDANPLVHSAAATKAHRDRLLAFIEAAAYAQRLADVPTASPSEVQRHIFDDNATAHPLDDVTLTELIERTFAATPDAAALVFAGERLTYLELERRSAALAVQLAALGAGPDRLVALALPRSLELVVALVAILRAGAAYLPLDLDHPDDRLARICALSTPVALLAQDADNERFAPFAPVLPVSRWATDGDRPVNSAQPENMAYVIYTSGSTGEPKGVVIEHRAIVNRLEWMRTFYGFGADDRILQKTPATFDVSVWEFFLPLIAGCTLVIAPPGAHRDPAQIAAIIRAERVTTCHFVPSMLSAFLASPDSRGLEIRRVFCSGEELTAEQRDRFHRTLRAELHNLYGPTEAAVDVSYWPAGPDDRSQPIPIGRPVWNTRLYVLDGRMRPVPAGVVGDLWLGGVQLARGYLGRADLTAERFLADPFLPGERIYRAGDVARIREDGAIEFLGRSDHQVKIRGLRIELGEIEAAISASGLVRETIVIAREDRAGDKRIVAYAVPTAAPETEALRTSLMTRLPSYMLPSAYVWLDAMPVTANGKLDRKALPAPEVQETSADTPATPTELAVGSIFADLLGLAQPAGPQADFFAMGGDSLSSVHLMIALAEKFGRDPGLGALFEKPTVADIARWLDEDGAKDTGLGPLVKLARGNGGAPLFLVHPAGGIAWGYRELAQRLAGDRDVWGIQSPALDPYRPEPRSLTELATGYAALIRSVADGPVHLAGWSVGGIIAQEMAAQMQTTDSPVGVVALLDAYPADCWRDEPEPDEKAALGALLTIAGHDPSEHPDIVSREQVLRFLKERGGRMGSLPEAALEGVVRSVLGTNRLVRGHRHSGYAGKLTHFRAALDHAGTALTPALWQAYAADVDAIDVPLLHKDFPTAQAAELVAPELALRMNAYDRRQACN